MQTPLRRVLYLGSAREGTSHFWRQRLTAIANVPLVIAFVVVMITLVGQPYDQVVATLASLPATSVTKSASSTPSSATQ